MEALDQSVEVNILSFYSEVAKGVRRRKGTRKLQLRCLFISIVVVITLAIALFFRSCQHFKREREKKSKERYEVCVMDSLIKETRLFLVKQSLNIANGF